MAVTRKAKRKPARKGAAGTLVRSDKQRVQHILSIDLHRLRRKGDNGPTLCVNPLFDKPRKLSGIGE